MVGRGFAVAAMALAIAGGGVVQGFQVAITNRCNYDIDLAHVVVGSLQMSKLAVGQTTTRELGANSPSNVFKSGSGGEATLAEITGGMGKVWFDISIIPTGKKSGPGYCSSLQECKDVTGGVGFNVPMQIIPSKSDGARCVTLTCMADGCADAYQFPKDDTKTHTCPGGTNLEVVFCPGGSGGQTPAPTPPPTTAAPTPSPTPAPTPSPTPTPSPSPTPAPLSEEESGKLASSSSSSTSKGSDAGDNTPTTTSKLRGIDLTGESEIAGEATSTPATAGTDAAAPVVNIGTTSAPVTEVSVQQGSSGSGSGAGVYVASILGCVAMVAGSAIFVVRKKKQQLDDLNAKTPTRDRVMTAAGALQLLTTPKENINIL
ncbi:hypothetical protein FI667_g15517, partial [Globisporangium splendens]